MTTPFSTEAASHLYFQFAADLLVELYQVVLEATFPYSVGNIQQEGWQRAVRLEKVSKSSHEGGLVELLSLSRRLNHLSPRMRRAILNYGQSHEAIMLTHDLADKLLVPVYGTVHGFSFRVSNRYIIGIVDDVRDDPVKARRHTVLRVRDQFQNDFVIDLSGSKHGQDQPLMDWSIYRAVWVDRSVAMQEREFGYAARHSSASEGDGWDQIRDSLAAAVDDAVFKYENERALGVGLMLRGCASRGEYESLKNVLVSRAREAVQAFINEAARRRDGGV